MPRHTCREALVILFTTRGCAPLVDDNAAGHLPGDPYSLVKLRDAVLNSIIKRLVP